MSPLEFHLNSTRAAYMCQTLCQPDFPNHIPLQKETLVNPQLDQSSLFARMCFRTRQTHHGTRLALKLLSVFLLLVSCAVDGRHQTTFGAADPRRDENIQDVGANGAKWWQANNPPTCATPAKLCRDWVCGTTAASTAFEYSHAAESLRADRLAHVLDFLLLTNISHQWNEVAMGPGPSQRDVIEHLQACGFDHHPSRFSTAMECAPRSTMVCVCSRGTHSRQKA